MRDVDCSYAFHSTCSLGVPTASCGPCVFSLDLQEGREVLPIMLTRFAADDLVKIVAAHRKIVGTIMVVGVVFFLQ